jgi:hypothetical protein
MVVKFRSNLAKTWLDLTRHNIKTIKLGVSKEENMIKQPRGRRPSNKVIITLIVLLIIVGLGTVLISHIMQNPAADVAKGIGKKLVSSGAVEQCGHGDAGFGPDNYEPHYGVSYMVAKDKNQAVALLEKAANESGFTLTHASRTDRGHLTSIADAYIDQWYFDDSKQSQYLFLKPGPIQLAASIRTAGDRNECNQSIIPSGSTIIGIGVQLPVRKF